MHAYDGRAPARRRRRAAAIAVGAIVSLGVASASASAALTITPTDDTELISKSILDDATTYVGAEFTTRPNEFVPAPDPLDDDVLAPAKTGAVVTPDAGTTFSGFPISGPDSGLLSSGDPMILENDPAVEDRPEESTNDDDSSGKELEDSENLETERGVSVHDATTLRIDFTVPPTANCLALSYRFLSDEFPEFVGSSFNDAFIAELDATTWRAGDDKEIVAPGDFATKAGGKPVSVNGVGPTAVFYAEAAGTTFDAATGLVTSKTPVTPGAHSVFLSIFDQTDHAYDSVVMLDRLGFIAEDPSTCKPPEVPVVIPETPPPPPAPGPPPPPPPVNDISTPGGSVTFSNGTFTVPVTVPGPGTLSAAQAPAATTSRVTAAAAATKKLVKRATKTVTQAGVVKLKMKLTKKGKKVLRKKGKVKVRLAITFTPTGGLPNTEVAKYTVKKKR